MQFLLQYVQGCCHRLFFGTVFALGLGQCTLVHLLVLVQWNSINLHSHGRHHVRRFLVEDKLIEGFDVDLLITDDVGSNKLTAAVLVKGLHSGVLDAGELTDDGLHLLQFDAETAYLHLSVLAPYKLDIAVGQVAHDVARAIDTTIPFISVERTVDVHLGGLVGTVQVAAPHLFATHPQFTGSAHGHPMSLFINDIQVYIVDGLTNGNILHFPVHMTHRYQHRGLRRTIQVDKRIGLWRCDRSQFLSSCGEVFQRMILDARDKLIGHLRGHEGMSDGMLLKIVVERHQVETDLLGNDMHRCTTGECRIDIHHVGIETVTGIGRHVMSGFQVVVAVIPMTMGHHITVFQLTTLRNTRGTGGVEKNEERSGTDGTLHLAFRKLRNVLGQQHLTLIFIHDGAQLFIGNQQFCIGILHHKIQSLSGICRVKRLIGTTCLQHAERGDDHPFTTGNDYRHHIFRRQLLSSDIGSDAVADFVHLGIGVCAVLIDHGNVLRHLLHALTEQRHDGLLMVVILLRLVETVEACHLCFCRDGEIRESFISEEALHHGLVTFQQLGDKFFRIVTPAIFRLYAVASVQDEHLQIE